MVGGESILSVVSWGFGFGLVEGLVWEEEFVVFC